MKKSKVIENFETNSNAGKLVLIDRDADNGEEDRYGCSRSYEWSIDDSCVRDNSGVILGVFYNIESPEIKMQTSDGKELKWVIGIRCREATYSWGTRKHLVEEVASLSIISLNQVEVELTYQLTIKEESGDRYVYFELPQTKVFSYNGSMRARHFPTRLILDETTGYLKNGKLTIELYLEEPTICDNLDTLMMSGGYFGDVSIDFEDARFRAHQVLLNTHGVNFIEISRNAEDEQQKCIMIEDIDVPVFAEILRFIYFNEIQKIEKYAEGLLKAATKYSNGALKKMCEKQMTQSVTSDNAVKYLDLADRFEMENLRKQIIEFMASNSKKMVKGSSFTSLRGIEKKSLVDLVTAMAIKMPEN